MAKVVQLRPPLDEQAVRSLHAGQAVLISGPLLTARDAAHKRLYDLLQAGQELPVSLAGELIYFVGPTPPRPGKVIGSAGPTTSSRMDAYSPALLAAGLRGMIGKGYRGPQVREALVKYAAVHLAAPGGLGALLGTKITNSEILAYEDLGPEAIRRLMVKDFPAIVAYDAHGKSIYGR
ncbi:MAG: fumarate hydratase C-terminal domain-containing protein [Phycisphaerae bacterium]|nr:fumarate hydratase C-terminal domain-containing protein [Phycisphaerae bacterium]